MRAYATNSVGTAYGNQEEFDTVGSPTVRTEATTSVSEWTESGSFGIGSFERHVTGLDPSTKYKYQECARDSVGWSNDGTLTWKTSPAPEPVIAFPDGRTSGSWETWTPVASPNAVSVTVRITYLPENGGDTVTSTDEIGACSRRTYNMAGGTGACPGFRGRASIPVQSLDGASPIMVERAMYRHDRGCGTDAIGAFWYWVNDTGWMTRARRTGRALPHENPLRDEFTSLGVCPVLHQYSDTATRRT